MQEIPPSGSVEAGRDLQARDIVTGIQQHFTMIFQQPFQPPADLSQLRADYLTYLRDSYRYLDMKGVTQVQQVTQQLALTAVYVPLKAHTGHTEGDHRIAGRRWSLEGEEPNALVETMNVHHREPVPIEVTLKSASAVVVLGDPGAGKSTLLKVLALALAEQPEGPLPILLPLNAYARHLSQQAEVSLSQFLGDYYASRQQKLTRVGELFQQALQTHQAVLLLDGLDEVQANRPHLVGLVQAFVAEHLTLSEAASGESTTTEIVAGNRLVVTSRIVGYDEAPLAGPYWHTYTLTDFTRDDIDQFVTQWTLAFARSIQGDTEVAREAAAQERRELLASVFSRPSVERLATNPLMLTILALIKYTGVSLPEERVKLYELYLQALIESWNRARSLDQYPVGKGLNYQETVQVLAPLALWLRQENPTAGLVTETELETWLANYYNGDEWGLPLGEARQRGRSVLQNVQKYSNLLLERGERQYGFLHLTLEEMLAAQGIAQLLDGQRDAALALFDRYLLDPSWHETLQLAVGFIGVIQRRPKVAGDIVQALLDCDVPATDRGRPAVFAGQVLLDMGQASVTRAASSKTKQALVETMQSVDCSARIRRDAGDLLGRLDWTPEPELSSDDLLLAPVNAVSSGLDRFCRIPGQKVWIGAYPVTNRQFSRFMAADGYHHQDYWSEDGWAWRHGRDDSQAPDYLRGWLKNRPVEKRHQPYWWEERAYNSPLFPVVGITWFEAEAYTRWLTLSLRQTDKYQDGNPIWDDLRHGRLHIRLPSELEWEAAIGGLGEYPWGDHFDANRLNCAEGWAGRDFSDDDDWLNWVRSDEELRRDAGLTAVTTYPGGVSQSGVWDGSGNVWEWMSNPDERADGEQPLRGGAWLYGARHARVSSRDLDHPANFFDVVGFRVVLAPVLS